MTRREKREVRTVWIGWHDDPINDGPCAHNTTLVVSESRADLKDLGCSMPSMKPRRFVAVADLRKLTPAELKAWLRRGR
jgi:hypothetical protein